MIRNQSFRNKLVLIVAPMTVALVILLGEVARPRLAEAGDARASHTRAVLADRTLRLVDELQDERALSAQYLASKGQEGRDALVAKRTEGDATAEEFLSYAKGLSKGERAAPAGPRPSKRWRASPRSASGSTPSTRPMPLRPPSIRVVSNASSISLPT